MPLPFVNGSISLRVNVEYDPQDFTSGAPLDPHNTRRPAVVDFAVVGQIGGHTVDLGVSRPDVPVSGLPADLDALAGTEPVAGLIAEYRDRLADLTVGLARLGMATGDGVALALSVEDLEFLRHRLTLTEHRWREAIDGAEAAAQQPRRDEPPPAGFLNIEPTPGGYRAAARIFGSELERVEQFGTRLARLCDLARDAAGHDGATR